MPGKRPGGGDSMKMRISGRAVRRRMILASVMLVCTATAQASQAHLGRWAIDPEGCRVEGDTAETAPLILTLKTLNWFVARCSVGKSYLVGKALHIQARCSGEGERYTIPVKLDLVGADRLAVTWDRVAVGEMKRCR